MGYGISFDERDRPGAWWRAFKRFSGAVKQRMRFGRPWAEPSPDESRPDGPKGCKLPRDAQGRLG